MFMEIAQVLTPEEVRRLQEIARSATFVDGRISNPHNPTKQNLQVDTRNSGYQDSSRIAAEALQRNEELHRFTFPVRIAPPLLCKYAPGMKYGRHPDVAFLPMQPTPLRSDVSCTIFLSDPAAYDGGELTIHLGSRPILVKGLAGSAVVYPSTIHEVLPVRTGEWSHHVHPESDRRRKAARAAVHAERSRGARGIEHAVGQPHATRARAAQSPPHVVELADGLVSVCVSRVQCGARRSPA
jgi:PKHD-type hydroxylase